MEEEDVLLLVCNIWANPPVSDVFWTLNGSKVDLEEGGFAITNDGFNSKLSANHAERSRHEGTYQCSADYSSGKYSKTFVVKLTGQLTQSIF